MSDIRGYVAKTPGAANEGSMVALKSSKRGDLVCIDWFTEMALEGRAFQAKAGTITTPLVGDAPITDARAEFCVDATAGLTIIPAYLNVAVRLGTGILHEYAAKSVGSVSTVGTAFVPLPLFLGSAVPALTTARVQAHAVTVTAEVATTTRRHWGYANPVVAGAGHEMLTHEWTPMSPPTLIGPSCFYVQVAASGTGPSYYASFDYVELTTVSVS